MVGGPASQEFPSGQGARRRSPVRTAQEPSAPLLARIKNWQNDESEVVLPRSEMAAAIGNALNQAAGAEARVRRLIGWRGR